MLLAILGWNRFLQAIIKRKSYQLIREQLAKERVALRVSERTNLAVELHDALSQNLTGLAFQLATAKSALDADPTSLPRHLDTAERMLVSSRTELKRCLADLRDNTLDEKDFDSAIRRTLLPVVGDVKTNISFNVSRQKLNDTTAHSILCIIRELAANAVLHGHATQLDIHGETDGHRLMFSVSDNGDGFDPSTRPGLAEGHFGLDGIHERVEHLNGAIVIDSAPGRGTCVTISEIIL
jgi:signal transduction histidine kinase